MALVLNEEQAMLRDSARGFVRDTWSTAELRRLRSRSSGPGHDPDLWQRMAELGWPGIPFPEDCGGSGVGFAELGVVFEELGRELVIAPLLSSVVLGGGAISLGGTDRQRQDNLPDLCRGARLLAFACQESLRHDPYAVETRATASGNGYVLNGRKVLVLDGESADLLIVAARTAGSPGDRSGLTLFAVDPALAGVTRQRNVLLDSRTAITLTLNDVRVTADSVVGPVNDGADIMDELFLRGAVALSADMLGGMQAVFETTIAYLKEREQFGVRIGSFQGLKHRAARWFCEVELTRSIVMDALRAIDEDRPDKPKLASVCKARASDAFRLSSQEAIQMHGGIGVTDEAGIGFYLKRARVSEMLFGDATWHRARFAALSGY